MRQTALKVREMISDGAISEAEGKELLSALDQKKSLTVDWLWNPFPRVQVTTAFGLGLVISALSIGLAVFSDVKFGRLFSLTVTPGDVSWFVGVRDQLMAWPFVALVFWSIAKLAQSRVRLRDLVAYLGLARLPMLIVVNAFRTATGLRGRRLTAALVAGLLVPEFASLLVLGVVL